MVNGHLFDLSAACVEDPFLARIVVAFGIASVELQPWGGEMVVSLSQGVPGVHCSHSPSALLCL